MKNCGIFFAAVLFAALTAAGCTPAAEKQTERAAVVSDSVRLWEPSDTVVCVVFGHGYTEDVFLSDTLELLSQQFGMEDDGGFIRPMIYPDDFTRGGVERIFWLSDIAEDDTVSGVITLGCPELTYRALSVIRGEKPGFPVLSLFPQDDILAVESHSTAVVDFAAETPAAGEDGIPSLEEETIRNIEAVPALLAESVRLVKNGGFPEPGEPLRTLFADTVGDAWNVAFYVDPETGIRSANHFTLSEK